MHRVKRLVPLGCLLLVTAAFAATLKPVASFDLPGPPGKRFDYLTIDYDDHYLLSAHLAAGLLYVIDLRTNQVVKAIPDVPGAEGVEFVPELKKVYTSNAGDNTIGVIDLKQMKVIKKLPTEAKPDGSAYAAPFHKIYVNLQDQNIFAAIDPATDEVVGRYNVGKCEGNHGMALDPEHKRAFLACEGNELMTVFDLEKYQPIAFLPLAKGPDVVKFDSGLRRIYVACYSGAISVFQEDDPDHFRKLEDFPVQKRVHSLGVDKDTHRVYAPEQEVDGRPAARMTVYEAITGQSATLR